MDREKINEAITRYLETNPNPDNLVPPPSTTKTILKRSHKRCTARPAFKTRYGRGGSFKYGGRLS